MEKSRVSTAAEKHKNAFNCCQAVVCTYSDLLGVDEKTAFRASEGFGLGISGMYNICGSVCAMIMLAGLKNSDGNLQKPSTKFSTFDLGKNMSAKFEEMNSSTVCAVLRGTDGKTDRLRSCRGCVIDAAKIVEEILFPDMFEPYDGPNE